MYITGKTSIDKDAILSATIIARIFSSIASSNINLMSNKARARRSTKFIDEIRIIR